jgi:hypothetical protein
MLEKYSQGFLQIENVYLNIQIDSLQGKLSGKLNWGNFHVNAFEQHTIISRIHSFNLNFYELFI